MLRFLRKYNKMLLVVAGSVLMVLFLLPQAMHQFGPNQQNQVIFRIKGRTFHGRDLEDSQAKLGALLALERTAGIPFFGFNFENTEHWMLLVQEAQLHGLIAGGDRQDELIASLADARARQLQMIGSDPIQAEQARANIRAQTYADLQAVLDDQRTRIGETRLTAAIADVYGVRRLLELYGGFATISTLEAATISVRALDTAVADMGFVDYSEALAEAGDPTTEQLEAHFQEFKDIDPATAPNGIGYRQQDAVMLEAVEVDLTRIRSAMTLDDIEVNKRWRQNKDTYGQDFATARQRVESDLLDERVAAVVRTLEELGHRALFRETSSLEAEGAFKKLPPDWSARCVSFESLAADMNAEIAKSVTLPAPAATVTRIVGWSTAQDLASRSMGRAYMTVGGRALSLPGVVLQIRELAPDSKSGLQVGVAFGPLTVPKEKIVFVRVLEARPAGPPDTLDEVRIRAVDDWKKLRAYELLKERINEIKQTVVNAGSVEALISAYGNSRVQNGVEVTRSGATLPTSNAPASVANTKAMRDAIMDLVEPWNPTEPVAGHAVADRVVVQALPEEFGIGVAIVKGRYPVTKEEMRTNLGTLSNRYASELYAMEKAEPPFTFARLKERLGYTVPERRNKDGDNEETDDAGQDMPIGR